MYLFNIRFLQQNWYNTIIMFCKEHPSIFSDRLHEIYINVKNIKLKSNNLLLYKGKLNNYVKCEIKHCRGYSERIE
jgi:hypothetical protein